MLRRLAVCGVAVIGLLGCLVIPTAQASEPPVSVVTVHGFLTRTATDLLVVSYTITVQGGAPLENAQLTTTAFPSAPVDLSTLQLDATAVPSGTITVSGSAMTVRVGLGADSANGGMLGNGSSLLSYEQRRPTGGGPNASTSATLTFSRDGKPGSVSSNSLSLMHPDLVLSIPPESGEDKTAPLGTGRTAGYAANLTNRGGPSDAVTLTLSLPSGLRLDAADGVRRIDGAKSVDGGAGKLSCAHGGSAVVTCSVGAVAHNAHIVLLVPVTARRGPKPGTLGTFGLRVAPRAEADQKPSDNSLTGRVRFTGIAVLHVALRASTTKVPVGRSVTIIVTIHNNGPQPARETFGILLGDSAHFRIARVTTKRKVRGPEFRIFVLPLLGRVVVWNAGTIAAHHTATAKLSMKARSAGTTHVELFGESAAGDPGCDNGSGPCGETAVVTLHAIKAR